MDSPKLDSKLKPTLSSAKSIDEGFESDPDRELSTAETESNQLPADVQQHPQQQQQPTFDILQRTDRDGVQHTQIARRSSATVGEGVVDISSRRIIGRDGLDKNRLVYAANAKVAIPRAAATAAAGSPPSHPNHHAAYNSISANGSAAADQRHHFAGKVMGELSNSRLAKATELVLRSSGGGGGGGDGRVASGTGRERLSFPAGMSNVSQVALINGKLICVNMPVTQIIPITAATNGPAHPTAKRHFSTTASPAANMTISGDKINAAKHQSYVMGTANNHHLGSVHHHQSAPPPPPPSHHHHHHQKYISGGGRAAANESVSIAQQVNYAIIQNANSSNTFYPAQGNISLISSQYGLKYKSTHLSGMQEQPAPVPLWSQTLSRQQRR